MKRKLECLKEKWTARLYESAELVEAAPEDFAAWKYNLKCLQALSNINDLLKTEV